LPRSGGTGTPTAATRAGAHAYSPSNEPLAEPGACQMCDLCPVADTVKFLGDRLRMGRKGRKGWGMERGMWLRHGAGFRRAGYRMLQRGGLRSLPPKVRAYVRVVCALFRVCDRSSVRAAQCHGSWRGVAWQWSKSAGRRLRRAGPPATPAAGLVYATRR